MLGVFLFVALLGRARARPVLLRRRGGLGGAEQPCRRADAGAAGWRLRRSSRSSTSGSGSRSRLVILVGNHPNASAQVGGIKLTRREGGPGAVRPALRRLPHAGRRQRRRQGRTQPRFAPAGRRSCCTRSTTAACRTRRSHQPEKCLGLRHDARRLVQGRRPRTSRSSSRGRRQGIGQSARHIAVRVRAGLPRWRVADRERWRAGLPRCGSPSGTRGKLVTRTLVGPNGASAASLALHRGIPFRCYDARARTAEFP